MLIYSEIKGRGEKGCARIYLTSVKCGCICSYARFMHSEMGMTMGAEKSVKGCDITRMGIFVAETGIGKGVQQQVTCPKWMPDTRYSPNLPVQNGVCGGVRVKMWRLGLWWAQGGGVHGTRRKKIY